MSRNNFSRLDRVSLGRADGFTDPNVYDRLETRDGNYWVGTAAGLYLLNRRPDTSSRSGSRFASYVPLGAEGANWINALMEDPFGVVCAGTREGMFRLHSISKPETVASA